MDVFITAMALFSYTPAPHTPAHIQHTHTVPKLVENLSIQTEPVTAGAVATVHMSGFLARYLCKQKPDIFRCIRSSRDRHFLCFFLPI